MNVYSTVIGIDAHARTNTVYAFDKVTGQVFEKKIDSEPSELIALIRQQGFSEPVGCCYESGPTGFHLARKLFEANIACHIAAISRLPKRKDRKKNDRLDAQSLSGLLDAGMVSDVWIPSKEIESHRNLSRYRHTLSKDLSAARQRVTSFLLRKGLRCGSKNWTKPWVSWIKKIKFDEICDEYVFSSLVANVERLELELAATQKYIAEFVKTQPQYSETIERLDSICGIALITAFAICVEIGDFHRFSRSSQLASYLGLVPSESSTGDKHSCGSITKCGNRFLRYLLIESASVFSRNISPDRCISPNLKPNIRSEINKCNTRLKKRRVDLRKRGKQANKAKVAIARELAGWIWHIATLPA